MQSPWSTEVVRLRWQDIDFERRSIRVWQGKGRKDRYVMLPDSMKSLLSHLSEANGRAGYVFPASRRDRHLSPRSAQRAMERAVRMAGITKRATCHSLRHSFATHLIEGGTDIRRIQKLLGHMKLETTTIYTKVAVGKDGRVQSPLDAIQRPKQRPAPAIGRMKISVQPTAGEAGTPRRARVELTIAANPRPIQLGGIYVRELRPGWLALDVPPLETWAEPLRWLTPQQRERIESAEFYELLQREITRRFLCCLQRPG